MCRLQKRSSVLFETVIVILATAEKKKRIWSPKSRVMCLYEAQYSGTGGPRLLGNLNDLLIIVTILSIHTHPHR